VPPFALVDNAYSLLSDSDVVMIDPIGTGLSRAAPGADPLRYADVEPDAQLVAAAIVQWLTANRRWLSPKYILGESYGGVRGPLVVRHLQARHAVFPSGLILISPALDYALLRFNPGNDLPYVSFLPTFAASAWFHQRIANPSDLHAHVAAAEAFAGGDYLLALTNQFYDGTPPFAGRMDEISLYNRALSPAQVASVFQAAVAGKSPMTLWARDGGGDSVSLSWLALATNVVLETNSELSTNGWTLLPATPTSFRGDTRLRVNQPITNGIQFFRLRHEN
jgi:carboxypeptidase C (cathepsin A)